MVFRVLYILPCTYIHIDHYKFWTYKKIPGHIKKIPNWVQKRILQLHRPYIIHV